MFRMVLWGGVGGGETKVLRSQGQGSQKLATRVLRRLAKMLKILTTPQKNDKPAPFSEPSDQGSQKLGTAQNRTWKLGTAPTAMTASWRVRPPRWDSELG